MRQQLLSHVQHIRKVKTSNLESLTIDVGQHHHTLPQWTRARDHPQRFSCHSKRPSNIHERQHILYELRGSHAYQHISKSQIMLWCCVVLCIALHIFPVLGFNADVMILAFCRFLPVRIEWSVVYQKTRIKFFICFRICAMSTMTVSVPNPHAPMAWVPPNMARRLTLQQYAAGGSVAVSNFIKISQFR